MKPTATFWLLLLLLLPGCFAAREARIESDYSYSGNFRRYRTYEFVTGAGMSSDTSKLGEVVLRRSVRSIFDQYHIFTEGYLNGRDGGGGMEN